mgnify:CR=1 FL=1
MGEAGLRREGLLAVQEAVARRDDAADLRGEEQRALALRGQGFDSALRTHSTFRLIGVPSSQTPQVFEVVAPLSVPRKTFFMGGIGGVFLAPAREKETSKKPDSPLQASH